MPSKLDLREEKNSMDKLINSTQELVNNTGKFFYQLS